MNKACYSSHVIDCSQINASDEEQQPTACLLAGGGVAMVDALMERFPIRFDPQIEGCFFHMWGKHLTPTLILCLLRFSLSSISVMENEAFFLFCFFNVHRLMGNHSRSAPFTTEHHH